MEHDETPTVANSASALDNLEEEIYFSYVDCQEESMGA